MTIGAEGAPAPTNELFVRRATKDGRPIVVLRGIQWPDGPAVRADVYPVTGLGVEPLPLGPYAFSTLDDAVTFVEEALLALEYLGCTVDNGTGERRLQAVPDPA